MAAEKTPCRSHIDHQEVSKAMEAESFFSQVLAVITNGAAQQAVIRDLQRHPANDKVMHIDFLRVRADVAIEVNMCRCALSTKTSA